MLKSLTNRCLFVVVFALITSTFGCLVQERKVELQGSTPTLATPQAPERQPTIAASRVEGHGRRRGDADRHGPRRDGGLGPLPARGRRRAGRIPSAKKVDPAVRRR